MRRWREPDLTAELVARVHREVPPAPDPADWQPLTDADFDAQCDRLCAQVPDDGFWVFAYGSLIWKPDFEHTEAAVVHVHGYRRAFCMHLDSWRGTPDNPGLMLALTPGGSCRGIAYRMPPDNRRGRMMRLLRREIGYVEDIALIRWCMARFQDGIPRRVLVFYCFAPGVEGHVLLPPDRQAERLARAVGHAGSGAEYLRNTVIGLQSAGVHDRYLWRLQSAVAARIRADHGLD
jgi:glutathione-specific gamma-glutamylcyclotransferase